MEPIHVPWKGRPTERQLVSFVEGVYRQHDAAAHRCALRITGDTDAAQDVVQEAPVALTESLLKGKIREDVGGWLLAVTRNLAIAYVRRVAAERQKHIGLADAGEQRGVETPDPPSPEVDWRAAFALAGLSGREQEVLTLRYIKGKSYAEVAALRGTAIHTVRSQCQAARDKLRAVLRRDSLEPRTPP